MKESNSIVLISGIVLILIIAIVPIILLWINRNRIHQISRATDRRLVRNPSQIREINTNLRETTIYTASFITITTLLAMCLFYTVHDTVENKIKPAKVKWIKIDTLNLKPGPIWFFYNTKDSTLNAQHTISETEKIQLINLLGQDDENYKGYTHAIDELAYSSNTSKDKTLYKWLLLLYAICGLIGVQLRTINNFIVVACRKNEFIFHKWWPWYLARPLQGFLTGGVVFLIIDGKQLLTSEASGGLSTLVLVVAFLGGFSTEEVYDLLRKLSKRLFGSGNQP